MLAELSPEALVILHKCFNSWVLSDFGYFLLDLNPLRNFYFVFWHLNNNLFRLFDMMWGLNKLWLDDFRLWFFSNDFRFWHKRLFFLNDLRFWRKRFLLWNYFNFNRLNNLWLLYGLRLDFNDYFWRLRNFNHRHDLFNLVDHL